MKIKEAIAATYKALEESELDNPALEARILLGHVTGHSAEYLITHKDEDISENQAALLRAAAQRRCKLEPIAYITGSKEFFGREFIVNSNVLIPRPDSEILVESVLADYKENTDLNILDLGTGSGCLIITLLLELNNATGIGVDVEPEALDVAKANMAKHHTPNLELLLSNWFSALKHSKNFDIIVANPPYISSSVNVARETMLHEPHTALFAKKNGLEAYEVIAKSAKEFLKPKGCLYLEIGYDQEKSVTDLYAEHGYDLKSKAYDLARHVRCLKFECTNL